MYPSYPGVLGLTKIKWDSEDKKKFNFDFIYLASIKFFTFSVWSRLQA